MAFQRLIAECAAGGGLAMVNLQKNSSERRRSIEVAVRKRLAVRMTDTKSRRFRMGTWKRLLLANLPPQRGGINCGRSSPGFRRRCRPVAAWVLGGRAGFGPDSGHTRIRRWFRGLSAPRGASPARLQKPRWRPSTNSHSTGRRWSVATVGRNRMALIHATTNLTRDGARSVLQSSGGPISQASAGNRHIFL